MKSQAFLSALLISLGVKVLYDTFSVSVNKIRIENDKWTNEKPLRLVQITDMHNRKFGKNNKRVFRQLEKFTPDIVLLTGDLIDRSTKGFRHVESFIEELTTRYEHVYFVNGNHECEHPKQTHLHDILIQKGVTVLINENAICRLKNGTINIIGINDAATDHDDLSKAMTGIDDKHYNLLLSHAPNIIWKEKSLVSRMNLILSGHTHGGQIRLPFIGAPVIPEQKYPASYDQGIYDLHENSKLYIDKGLGTTRVPVRFFCSSQISYLEIFHHGK